MTAKRNLKRRVRARAAKTGESYTSALRHFRLDSSGEVMPETKRLRIAVAQLSGGDPCQARALRTSGADIRSLMRTAHASGARIIHFPEGATAIPNKRRLSSTGPDEVGPADWTRVDWDVLRSELDRIAALAGELRLWTVLGSVHRLSPPHRPHNSLYLISDRGTLVDRYDERNLSNTKVSYMYSPGSGPCTFEVDGVRFGCLLGMEVHFPELFGEYERLGVDCVLFSSTGGGANDNFATEARGHAAVNSYWVSYAVSADYGAIAPSGLISPRGDWLGRCRPEGAASFVAVDLDEATDEVEEAVFKARPWRRTVRAGLYDPYLVRGDARSENRTAF